MHIYQANTWSGRMGILENRSHSTGAIYHAINDLPWEKRFLQINAICAAVLPRTNEPNVQQINHCLEPSVNELMILKNGALVFHLSFVRL